MKNKKDCKKMYKMPVSNKFKKRIMRLTFNDIYLLKSIYENHQAEHQEEYKYIVNLLRIYEEVENKKR